MFASSETLFSQDIQPELSIPRIDSVENPELGPTAEQWSRVSAYTRFFYPWEKEAAPPTSLKMCWDGAKIYFEFSAVDAEPIAFGAFDNKMDVCASDRVEIFLDSSDKMDRYYGLEMDPSGRVLDYQGRFYRNSNYQYSFPALKSTARRTPDGYCVSGSLDVETLNQLGLIHQNRFLRAGFFRADFYRTVDQAATDKPAIEKWISWKHTGTKEADFHVPGALGWVELAR